MSEKTLEELAQIAREWAEEYPKTYIDHPVNDVINFILSTTGGVNMSHIPWNGETHSGLCAKHPKHEVVRMIYEDGEMIDCILPDTSLLMIRAEELTPIPGTRVDLTPRHESVPESTPEPEQPQPEDVKPEPQPGEAWLIEFEGKRYEAIYWYSPLYAHWVFVKDRESAVSIESHEATPLSRLVEETVPSHPEFLETEEDYESAPEGTIVANDLSDPWVKDSMGFWLICGEGGSEISRLMALSARRVLRWGETL